MKSMKAVCLLCALSLTVAANATVWVGWDAGDVWNEPTNWSGGTVPGSDDTVEVIYDTQPCILDSDGGTIKTLHVANGEVAGTGASMIIANGGSLIVEGGYAAPGWNRNGSLTIETGGSMICNTFFTVGMYADIEGTYAHLNLEGGTLTVNNAYYHGIYFGSTPVEVRSQINAGILDVDALSLDRGIMDITYGTVIVNGDITGSVTNWVNAGLMTAFDGEGTIITEVIDGRTYITAVPEPATMVLLGLGGLITLRRKRK